MNDIPERPDTELNLVADETSLLEIYYYWTFAMQNVQWHTSLLEQ
jgi:hypothetical protein